MVSYASVLEDTVKTDGAILNRRMVLGVASTATKVVRSGCPSRK
jgi:hypothetical protein